MQNRISLSRYIRYKKIRGLFLPLRDNSYDNNRISEFKAFYNPQLKYFCTNYTLTSSSTAYMYATLYGYGIFNKKRPLNYYTR